MWLLKVHRGGRKRGEKRTLESQFRAQGTCGSGRGPTGGSEPSTVSVPWDLMAYSDLHLMVQWGEGTQEATAPGPAPITSMVSVREDMKGPLRQGMCLAASKK